MKIIEFCNKHNILWFPIHLDIIEKNGKKEKVLQPIDHKLYNGRPKQTDFNDKTVQFIQKRQTVLQEDKYASLLKYIAMDTRTIQHIDIDTPEYDDSFNKIAEMTPYFKSTTKSYGKHILITSDYNGPLRNQFKSEGVELLAGQWSYAPMYAEIFNAELDILKLENVNSMLKEVKEGTTKNETVNSMLKEVKEGTTKNETVNNIKIPEKLINEIKEHGNNIDIKYINCYDDWTRIIWSLKSYSEDLKDVARDISKKSKKYEDEGFNKTWDCYNLNNSRLTLGTFYHFSKLSNKTEYVNIKIKYSPRSIEEAIIYQTTEVVTRCFYELFGDDFIYKDKKTYHYNGIIWEENENSVRYLFTRDFTNVFIDYNKLVLEGMKGLDRDSDEYGMKSKKADDIKKLINKLQTNRFIKDCCKDSIITYIEKPIIEFELNAYSFCFNNKVYDLDKMDFVDVPNREDYMILSTGYDWREPTDEEIKEIEGMLQKVFPFEKERELYLILLSTGMFGKTLEKFGVSNGKGRNGKGFLNELVMKCLGGYGYTCANAVLMSSIKDGANQSIANMNNKRMIIYREPDADSPYSRICSATVKELTGGNEIGARGLFSTNTKVNLRGTHILECNKKVKIGGGLEDDAMPMRLIDVLFRSKFTKDLTEVNNDLYIFEGNDEVKTQQYQDKHKFAMFHILLKYWGKYKEKKMNIDAFIPDSVKERGLQYLTDSNNLLSYFISKYKKTVDNTNIIKIKDFIDLYKNSDDYSNMTKKEKRELSDKKIIELFESNPYTRKYYKDREQRKEIQQLYLVTEMRNILTNFTKIEEIKEEIKRENEEEEIEE